jgi:hypothetical protein
MCNTELAMHTCGLRRVLDCCNALPIEDARACHITVPDNVHSQHDCDDDKHGSQRTLTAPDELLAYM